jgi:hypothetical protein
MRITCRKELALYGPEKLQDAQYSGQQRPLQHQRYIKVDEANHPLNLFVRLPTKFFEDAF